MKLEELQDILNNITYTGVLQFIQPRPVASIEPPYNNFLIRIELLASDSKSQRPVLLKLDTRVSQKDATEEFVLALMRETFTKFFAHEICECMWYKDILIFDPHPDVPYAS